MKEMKKKKGILDDNTVITLENIEKLSQCFAQSALKSIKKYAYSADSKIEIYLNYSINQPQTTEQTFKKIFTETHTTQRTFKGGTTRTYTKCYDVYVII